MKDYYSALGVDTYADYESVSRAYKKLALQYHPDKANLQPRPSHEEDKFILIQEAWETLRDSERKKQYDKELEQELANATVAVSDEISLDDMQCDEEGDDVEYFWPCRCGDKFVVSEAELEEGVDLVFCRSCSFAIKINV